MRHQLFLSSLIALTLSAPVIAQEGSSAMSGHEEHAGHGMADLSPPLTTDNNAEEAARTPGPGDHAGHEEGPDRYLWLKLDQLEAVDPADGEASAWKGGASWGTSLDRIWLTSEGSREDGRLGDVDTQLYWSHAFRRWWNTTVGVRTDNGPGDSRTWAAVGVRGLAPYWFEAAATLYFSDNDQTALRLEADYELLLTNRLILQPEVELNFYGREEAARQQGEGLADSTVGLRLRYEVRRKFAPYVGVEWVRLYGQTEDLASAAGERVHDGRAVAGVRIWY